MDVTKRGVCIVFVMALCLRLAYLGIVAGTSGSFYAPDSTLYVWLAEDMVASGGFNHRTDESAREFRAETERVPVYVAYLAGFRLLFGPNPLWPILGQCILDSVTCLLIGFLAAHIRPGLFFLAGMLAAFNLNLIAHSALILTDSLFLLSLTASLLMTVRFLRMPTLQEAFLVGSFMGLALLTRAMMLYFVPLLLVTILLSAWRSKPALFRVLSYFMACLLPMMLLVGPWLQRNATEWDHYRLESHSGGAALFWIVPLAKEFSRGIPRAQTQEEVGARLKIHLEGQGLQAIPRNPFDASDQYMAVAIDELRKMSVGELMQAWVAVGAINLLAPSISVVPMVATLERPHFSETPGRTPFEKILNIMRDANSMLYVVLIAAAAGLTVLFRCVQIGGLYSLIAGPSMAKWAVGYLLLMAMYVQLVTSVFVDVKYRLPLEPMLIVFTAAGVHSFLMSRWGLALRRLFIR